MLEENEDVLVGARRELEEETGLIFKDFYLVHTEQPNPSAEWISYTVVTTGYAGGIQNKKLDVGERMRYLEYLLMSMLKRSGSFFYVSTKIC